LIDATLVHYLRTRSDLHIGIGEAGLRHLVEASGNSLCGQAVRGLASADSAALWGVESRGECYCVMCTAEARELTAR